LIKAPDRKLPGRDFGEQDRRNQVAANDKKDIQADKTTQSPWDLGVIQNNRDYRDRE
jgi:hypothetical protein